ncbi:NAD(P) transhydrogenase subunit alpha [Mesonia sp. K7]|uniref:NAD(P) transhydrogenase subunit alpha n=1 Tax=Mesonia sp. K7 TaxID=2218606 RepID=UPI000DA9931C|nr:NAD(P) transhydrogenase subunit alpha [Mesonia sp. K7]PZD76697.1 NAD(P) transhydrogenase subunit alpha [Mesonia sp. K7]
MGYSIGLIKEPIYETRIALLPDEIKKLKAQYQVEVLLEKDYGTSVGISDEAFMGSGAVLQPVEVILEKADFILSINDVLSEELPIPPKAKFIGVFNALFFPERLQKYEKSEASVYSLDQLPRTTIAQTMDVRSSMDALSGYQSILKAAQLYGDIFPMMTTASKTLQPVNVLVLGAGVAGLQAIATAKRLGAEVYAFDVRKAAGEEVRSLGAHFIEVEGSTESHNAGGYAVEQSSDYKKRQEEEIKAKLASTNIVICTANIPGKKAPLLLNEESLKCMPPNSVVIDLAAEQGGNCSLTKNNELTSFDSITIYGNSYLSRELPMAASKLLAANFYNFLKYMIEKGESHELISACQVTFNLK